MGRSPEILSDHSAAGPAPPRLIVGGSARGGARKQDVPRELLEEVGLGGVHSQVPQLHLCLSPGERGAARPRVGVAMLVGEVEQLPAISRDAGPVGDARRAARGNLQAVTQCEHRIEHGACRA